MIRTIKKEKISPQISINKTIEQFIPILDRFVNIRRIDRIKILEIYEKKKNSSILCTNETANFCPIDYFLFLFLRFIEYFVHSRSRVQLEPFPSVQNVLSRSVRVCRQSEHFVMVIWPTKPRPTPHTRGERERERALTKGSTPRLFAFFASRAREKFRSSFIHESSGSIHTCNSRPTDPLFDLHRPRNILFQLDRRLYFCSFFFFFLRFVSITYVARSLR